MSLVSIQHLRIFSWTKFLESDSRTERVDSRGRALSFCVRTRQQHNVVSELQLVVSFLISTLTSHAGLESYQSQTHLPSQCAQHTCGTCLILQANVPVPEPSVKLDFEPGLPLLPSSLPTTTTSHLTHECFFLFVNFQVSLASEQPMSAAQRRKGRRLRSWWRHEQQSIAMAAATHHSAQQNGAPWSQTTATRVREEVEHVTNVAPRRQMAPPPWTRPGILAELGPQSNDRRLQHSSQFALPTLGLPVLPPRSPSSRPRRWRPRGRRRRSKKR